MATFSILKRSFVISACLVLVSVISANAANKFDGTYQGNIGYRSAKAFGPSGRCYTKAEYPTLGFAMTKIKVARGRITGKWGTAAARGSLIPNGFKMSFKYDYSYWTFSYKVNFTGVTSKKAKVALTGKTYPIGNTKSGCTYYFAGTVKHTK